MKKIFRNLMMLLCALTALVSCDESGDKIYLDGFKASDLMASASDVKLSVDNSKDVVLSLAWQNPTLLSSDETKPAGSGVLKTYLQVSASENFTSEKEYTVTDLSKAFTGADLNSLAKDLGTTPGQSAPLYFRIRSQMGNNLDAAYSNVCQVNVTPYSESEASNTLCMFSKDGNTLLAVMNKVSDGVYTCKYKPTAWEGFMFIYVGANKDDKQTWYGCEPSNDKMFNLSTADDKWNPWFKDDVTGGDVTVTADLNTMTWKYEYE